MNDDGGIAFATGPSRTNGLIVPCRQNGIGRGRQSIWHPRLREQLVNVIRRLIFSGGEALAQQDPTQGMSGHAADGRSSRNLHKQSPLLQTLADLVLSDRDTWSLEHMTELIDATGVDYLGKLAILELISRDIGLMWITDETDFARVTIAVSRLQTMLRRMSGECVPREPNGHTGTVLLTTPPGEEHTFPLLLLEELFRSRGWQTDTLTPRLTESLGKAELDPPPAVICFSWSTGSLKDTALETVHSIRAMAPSGRTLLMAGGISAAENRNSLLRLGVDMVCANSYVGLSVAERFAASLNNQGKFAREVGVPATRN